MQRQTGSTLALDGTRSWVVFRGRTFPHICYSLCQTTSRLPLELYVLIAEHLAGDHAFGTAAQLNCVSKAVHAETSSVLWESVYLDNYSWSRWERENGLPANLKYTK
jgi:hypothetical protein